MQNVVTLELVARLNPDAEPERQVWWVHEPGASMSNEPVPAACLLPFWQLVSRLAKDVARRLIADRQLRGTATEQLEGVGQLDAQDIAWLHSFGTLVISTDSGLLAIGTVLDRLVEVQPGLIEVAENWRAWLTEAQDSWSPGSRFELRWGALFTEGAVFERVLSFRVFDAARFFLTCEGAAQAERLREDMSMLLTSVGLVPTDDDPDAQRLRALRAAVTHNRLDDFLSLVDPSREADARLIGPAFSAAIAAAPERAEELTLQRSELAARCSVADVRLQSLQDAIETIHAIRSEGRVDEAIGRYTVLLDHFAADFLEDNEFLESWLRLLSNLSYLLIEERDQPETALDLLLARVQAFDAREPSAFRDEPETSRCLQRTRANLDAAVARLQSRGVAIPPGLGTNLSTTDRSALDQADDDFISALDAPDPERARHIAEWALDLLTQRGIASSSVRYVEWRIDWARATRDLGDLELAATTLREVIAACSQSGSMTLRTSGGRASVALGVTYQRMDRTPDEIATYQSFLASPEARETTRSTQLQVSYAHANLGDALARTGKQKRAIGHYLNAAEAADRLGETDRSRVFLEKAAGAARISGDTSREREIRARLHTEDADQSRQKNRSTERGLLGWLRGRS